MTQHPLRLLAALIFLLLPLSALAQPQVFSLSPELSLELTLTGDQWVAATEPPQFLIEERAEHAAHELEHQGKQLPSRDQLLTMVRRQLSGNEVFIYNPETGAHLDIDFSPLEKGEDPPSLKSLKTSARYAGQSLESEEGVSGVEFSSEAVDLPWAEKAYRMDADYLLHEEKRKFIGIVAFARGNWAFLYYTDPLKREQDRADIEAILSGLKLK